MTVTRRVVAYEYSNLLICVRPVVLRANVPISPYLSNTTRSQNVADVQNAIDVKQYMLRLLPNTE